MLPITRMISAYNHYDYNAPKYIILHYTGNSKDTAYNNAKYFNGGNRNASAHYFVDDNSIYQVVEDNKGAWHVGNTKTEVNNKNSIGIEMCTSGNYQISEKTEANAIELVKYLMNKYNIPIANVRTHAEVTKYGKTCPNWNANNWQRWNNFKAKLVAQQPVQQPQSQPQPSQPTNSQFKVGNHNGYVVTTDSLNVRSQRNGGSTLLTTIPKGTKVYVRYVMYQDNSATPKGALWGGVEYNGKTGFINLNYVQPTSAPVVNTSFRVKINTAVLNVRKGASASTAITTQVRNEEVYTIVEERNGWGRLKSGAGWINLSYTKRL